MEYPELAARTRWFTRGAPRAVTVAADGTRVVFLRSDGPDDPVDALWVLDVPGATDATGATGPTGAVGATNAAGPAGATERLIADPAQLAEPRGTPPAAGADTPAGIGTYAVDPAARVAAFTYAGRLFRADLVRGDVVEVATAVPVTDPRPDPTGQRIAYVGVDAGTDRSTLRVVGPDGTDVLLAGETDGRSRVSWGIAEFVAARRFGRTRGYWWAPDGRSVLAARVDESRVPRWHLHDPAEPSRAPARVGRTRAGGANARVSLHLLDLDGGWVDVHWDRESYPYLVGVRWADGGPLITVLRRPQQHGLVLLVDPRTGETQVHAELADPRWVEPVDGTPRHLPDGRVLVGGELAHEGFDARCLFADGSLLTPPSLYVRRVVGRLAGRHATGPSELVVEGSEGEPSEQHVFRVRTATGGGAQARRLTTAPGWHVAAVGGDVLVIGAQSLEHAGTQWTVRRGDTEVARLESVAAAAPYAPRPVLERVTDRQLPTAVLYPRQHVAGRRLPVLLDVFGGPGRQEVLAVRAAWVERQWWADAGFAVVTVDNRGTPGVGPGFEKVVHRRLADVILTDQVDALTALAGKHPDLDLDRVAVRGHGLGGWLAGLAVLRRPDLFACAVAHTPVTDWTLLDTAFAERYLGLPDEGAAGGEVYAHHSLIELAGEDPGRSGAARPLLLVHGLTDTTVLAAHTVRLSAALLSAARPHAVLPLTGDDPAPAGLLRLELDFVRRHLPWVHPVGGGALPGAP